MKFIFLTLFICAIILTQTSYSQELQSFTGVIDGKVNHYISKDGRAENYSFYLLVPKTQDRIFVTVYIKSLGKTVGEFDKKSGDVVNLTGQYREREGGHSMKKFLSVNSNGWKTTTKVLISTPNPIPPAKTVAVRPTSPPPTDKFKPLTEKEADKASKEYNKSLAKARQAEAKIMLSSLYVAEMSFRAEFDSFTTDLVAVGLLNDSKAPFYLCGFNKPMTGKIEFVTELDQARLDTGFGAKLLPPNHEALKAAIPIDTTASKTQFKAACVGNVDHDATLDIWVIDEKKQMKNISDDAEN